MPSKKKRITVYVTDEQYALVQRTAAATGESMGGTLAGILEAAEPMLTRVADLAEALRAAPEDVRATFAGAAEQLETQYGGILADSETFWDDLDRAARGGLGDGDAPGPRLVIRGPES